jgi:hypothetical protein
MYSYLKQTKIFFFKNGKQEGSASPALGIDTRGHVLLSHLNQKQFSNLLCDLITLHLYMILIYWEG